VKKVLNLGAGDRIYKGDDVQVVNHDLRKHRPEIDVAWDLNYIPWPWPDEEFDMIIASSVFEHLEITLVESFNECWRILKPKGILKVAVPYWKHENAYADPTHRWRFDPKTFDFFDPSTELGKEYSYYTPYKWEILDRANTIQMSSLLVVLRKMT